MLWSPFVAVRPGRRARRPAARSTSAPSFRPTYNMAANLVALVHAARRRTTCSTCRSRSTSPIATSSASKLDGATSTPLDAAGARRQRLRRHLGVPSRAGRGAGSCASGRRMRRARHLAALRPDRWSTPARVSTADRWRSSPAPNARRGMRLTTITRAGRRAPAHRRRLRRRAPPARATSGCPAVTPRTGRTTARKWPVVSPGGSRPRRNPCRRDRADRHRRAPTTRSSSTPICGERMRAAGQAERLERELGRPRAADRGPPATRWPATSIGCSTPRPPGLPRPEWALTERGRSLGARVPRVRSVGVRVPPRRRVRRSRRPGAGRAAVDVRVRAPQPRTAAAGVVPLARM